MSLVLGIDLGTSFSCAAAVRDGVVMVVEDEEGRRTMPSVVNFAANGRISVGHHARQMMVNDPEHTIHSAKRLLGRRIHDEAVRVAQSAFFYRVAPGPNQWPVIEVPGGPFTVPEICACLLRELRKQAEEYFGEKINQAVITVPANADDSQREQTSIAGRIAGLEVLRLLNEPTAAALAQGGRQQQGRRMAVYDFGGGTFDCSVIEWGSRSATVLATHGSSFLGGDDIDLALATKLAENFQRRHDVDLRQRAAEWKGLLLAAEAAKRRLSRQPKTKVRLPAVAHAAQGALDLVEELDRGSFNELARPYVEESIKIMMEALTLAGGDEATVDTVLLVGGSSQLPLVRDAVKEATGRSPFCDIDADTAVAMGAAMEAARLVSGGTADNFTVPGAPAIELIEVVPRSIGLATAGGGFDPVIRRNSRLPASGRRSYTTWRDGQQEMRFVVLQGDRERASDNARIGEFIVDNLPIRPAGKVEVKLLFEVGSDGLLRASAHDTITNQVHRYRVRVADSILDS